MKSAVDQSGTSAKNVAKAEIAFSQYEYMDWLDDFLATSQGKGNLLMRSQFKEDEDRQSLNHEKNLVIPPDIIPTSKSIAEADIIPTSKSIAQGDIIPTSESIAEAGEYREYRTRFYFLLLRKPVNVCRKLRKNLKINGK